MNRTNFFDGMEVSASDLQYAQAALEHQIKSSRSDIISAGVTSPVDSYVQLDPAPNGSTDTPTIRILPFSAYNYSGERIQTSLAFGLALDLTDTSNRLLGEQGSLADADFGWEPSSTVGGSTTYYICVRYIERGARPLPQEGTSIPYASRVFSGYQFYALRQGIDSFLVDGINPYIILATATYSEDTNGNKTLSIQNSGVTQYAVIDGSRVAAKPTTIPTSSYDLTSDNNITLENHINAIYDINSVGPKNPHGITAELLGIDTQSVPIHEKLFHSDGLLAGVNGIDTTISGFYAFPQKRDNVVDSLRVYNLSSDELLHYKGKSITYFRNKDITYADIRLYDSNGIWPDGTYNLYISTATNNIFISVPNNSDASSRSYYTIYSNSSEPILTTPIIASSIDPSIHYLLYSFEFYNEKVVSLAVEGFSNFYSLTDNRTFGSISSDNLQRNAQGILSLPYTVGIKKILFDDQSTLSSATNFMGYENTSNCITLAPNGVFTISDNFIRFKKGLTILCTNGISTDGLYNSISSTFKTDISSSTQVPTTEGTYYILTGKFSIESTQEVFYAPDYVVSSTAPENPIELTCWYNPNENRIRLYSDGSWGNYQALAKVGRLVVNENGQLSDVIPDIPFKIMDYNTYRELIGVDSIKKSVRSKITRWFTPDYSAGISINWNTETTVTKPGVLFVNVRCYSSQSAQFILNGVSHQIPEGVGGNYASANGTLSEFIVDEGDVFKFTGSYNRAEIIFYPCKGVN